MSNQTYDWDRGFHQQNDSIHSHSVRGVRPRWITQIKKCLPFVKSPLYIKFGVSSYWRNELWGKFRYTGRLIQWLTTAVWARDKTALCWSNFLPWPVLHRQPYYNLAILGQQPVSLRGSGSDPCPDLKHLPCRLPKRTGSHPLESPSSVHVRFG